MADKKYIALIPAYKPEGVLIELLEELCSCGFECVVVDDGGGEAFSEIFARATRLAKVLTHHVNKGKGAAMKTGFAYIKEHYGDDRTVVTVDADGQHKVADALRICHEAEDHPGTLVLGSRKFKGKIPFRSKMGNAITRFVYRISTGLRVHDTQTGLRAFSTSLLQRLVEIPGDRYEYEMNVLLDFARHRIPIKELDIETVYIGKNESSHFNVVKDSFRIYKEILKFSASSLVGFLVDYAIFSILTLLSAPLVISNVIARVISSSVNFTLNRKFVFKNKDSLWASALKYFSLAAFILLANTLILRLLVNSLGMNKMLAKVLTEIVLYVLSWLVQRFFVFNKKTSPKEKKSELKK